MTTEATRPIIDQKVYIAALKQLLSEQQLDQALAATGRKFRDRLLPAKIMLLVSITTFIQATAGLAQVLRWFRVRRAAENVTEQALYQYRERLGWRPYYWLRRNAVKWLAKPSQDPSCFYHDKRLVIIDGTTLTVADTPANLATFGKSSNQRGDSAFPIVRVAVLCELGTRAFVKWIARSYHVAEKVLSLRLLGELNQNQLLLCDRNFHSYELWNIAKNQQFSMLLRVRQGLKFPVETVLPDGSYLSKVLPQHGPKPASRGIPVRVIDYWLIINDRVVRYRLLTNLFDHEKYPAKELMELYGRRWEAETAFGEFKGQLQPRTTALRAGSPKLVMAELDALLIGYYVVRKIALKAARLKNVAPDRISFTQVVNTLHSYIQQPQMGEDAFFEMAGERLNTRRNRSYPRCRKTTKCKWNTKKPEDKQILYNEILFEIITPETPSLS
jgi:hypothetical protein